MTYPVISSPYGLKPYNLIGGRVFAGSTRMLPITNGYASNLNNGDVVQISTTTGTIVTSTLGTPGSTQSVANGTVGIFLGCEYATAGGPIYGLNRFNNWVGGTSAITSVAAASTTGVTGYVLDDPQAVFKVVALANNGTATSTSIAAFGPNFLGGNVQLVLNASSTVPINGDSTAGVCGITGNVPGTGSTSGPFRVVQFVPETALAANTTITATATSATQTVASTAGIYVGMSITGTGVAANTFVTSITNSTTVVANASITGTSGNAISFFGYPEVLVAWNFGYHGYFNATGV